MTGSGIDKKLILVVDDEPAIRKFCQRVLSIEGCEVDTAPDGIAAQPMISKRDYDLYLVDIKMPLMNGQELFESLQKKSPHLANKVVFTTSSMMGPDTESFLKSSGRPLLVKPFTIEELKTTIRRCLE